MQAAPPVSYPLGRPRLQQVLLCGLLLLNLAVLAAVVVLQPGFQLALAMGLLQLPAGWLMRRAWRAPGTRLAWDGDAWHLEGPHPVSGQLQLALDMQRALLLRWVSPTSPSGPASHWLWIEESANPLVWKGVRRAVYWNAR